MSTANACVLRKPEATPSPGIYRRRRPERTVLYQAVQANIETYLCQARWEDPLGGAVPVYVEHDLRQYLTCGLLAHDFARAFFAMNAGMTFLSPSLVKAEAFACCAIPGVWVSKDRMSGG